MISDLEQRIRRHQEAALALLQETSNTFARMSVILKQMHDEIEGPFGEGTDRTVDEVLALIQAATEEVDKILPGGAVH